MADDAWLSTEEMATWRAVDALVRRLPAALEAQLTRDSGLSLTEYYVLAGLADQPGHSVRMSRLAELAHCELSRLSHLVKRLERRGWARREPDREDRRYTRAVLTEAGHAHLVAAAPAHVVRVRRVLLDALTVDERTALREAASAVVDRLDDLGV